MKNSAYSRFRYCDLDVCRTTFLNSKQEVLGFEELFKNAIDNVAVCPREALIAILPWMQWQ